ncbi:NAD(P)-binding protein [Mycobacterium sp.]|uniref:NAD(P)-binding protein n=1 Tax=Mycobacterium sp. TaxID=1785 RepID=UPI003C70A27E
MRILISGAGVAGLGTAIDLGADGHDITIVERAHHLRVNVPTAVKVTRWTAELRSDLISLIMLPHNAIP